MGTKRGVEVQNREEGEMAKKLGRREKFWLKNRKEGKILAQKVGRREKLAQKVGRRE